MLITRLETGQIRELTVEEKERYPGRKYVVATECVCHLEDAAVVVPSGFLTDGSSGGPDFGWSWLIHDYLYASHCFADGTPCTRSQADKIMYNILLYERHRGYAFMYKMATKFGAFIFAHFWRTSGAKGPQFLRESN